MKFKLPEGLPKLRHQEEAVLYFCQLMDWEMVGELLDSSKNYHELPHWEFVARLRTAFDTMKANGDTKLFIHTATCTYKMCNNYKESGYLLQGNHSHDYLALLIEIDKDNNVLDIFECYQLRPIFVLKYALRHQILISNLEEEV